jgi:hypothetical protein
MRYRLILSQGTPENRPIKQGRRFVGSVRKSEAGTAYVGRIGLHTAAGATQTIAFREVAAVALGYTNAAALAAHNTRVRAENRAMRARSRRRANVFDRPRSEPGPVDDEPFELA